MFNLINRKGKDGQNAISRHKLDKKMLEWLDKQPTVKFTGLFTNYIKQLKSDMDGKAILTAEHFLKLTQSINNSKD